MLKLTVKVKSGTIVVMPSVVSVDHVWTLNTIWGHVRSTLRDRTHVYRVFDDDKLIREYRVRKGRWTRTK